MLPHSVFTNTTSISHSQSSGENYGQLEAMIHFNGPMQIGINAGIFKWKIPHGQGPGKHWVNKSGCAAAKASGLKSIDHSLGVVGFGTDPEQGDYWIIKNSVRRMSCVAACNSLGVYMLYVMYVCMHACAAAVGQHMGFRRLRVPRARA